MVVYYSREWLADGRDPHWVYWWQDCSYFAAKDYGCYWIVPGTHDELED